jgi:hypothetical protein
VTEAGCEHLGLRAVLAHAHQRPAGGQVRVAGLEEVEVPRVIGFQARVVGVLAGTCVPVVADALVEVGLAVVVQVVQPGELPAFQHYHLPVHDLEPERVVQPGGVPLPRARRGLLVHGDEPHVAVAGADRDSAVFQVIDAGAEEQRVESGSCMGS